MGRFSPTMWISWKSVQNCDLYPNIMNFLQSGTSKTVNVTTLNHLQLKSEVEGVIIGAISF